MTQNAAHSGNANRSIERADETAGTGTIGRKTAWAVTLLFMVGTFLPGAYQTYYDLHILKRSLFADLVTRPPTSASLVQFEKDLTQQSRFDRWVRHTYAKALTGSEIPPATTLIGRDGFLFTVDESRVFNSYSLVAPAPSPAAEIMPTLVDFRDQLRRRGIQLVLLPIPMKLSIYPEKLAIDYRNSDGPALPPGFVDWLAQARQAGFDVIDLTDNLWSNKSKSPDPVFWPTDTHWSHRGRLIADDFLADHLRPMVASYDRAQFDVAAATVDMEGDLARVLTLGFGNTKYAHMVFQCDRLMRDGKPFVAGDEAPILLMGDSFAIMGNEDGTGFVDDLMARLGVEIQGIGRPADPLQSPRMTLVENPNILAHKKLVIWEFAVHSMWNPWEKIQLP